MGPDSGEDRHLTSPRDEVSDKCSRFLNDSATKSQAWIDSLSKSDTVPLPIRLLASE